MEKQHPFADWTSVWTKVTTPNVTKAEAIYYVKVGTSHSAPQPHITPLSFNVYAEQGYLIDEAATFYLKESSNGSPCEGGSNPSTRIEDSESPKKRKSGDGDGQGKLRPKRPLTGYNRFFKEERVRWMEQQSNSGTEEVNSMEKKQTFLTMGKEISARWVRLPREQKEKYVAEYDKEMFQYRIDVENHNREKERTTAHDCVAEREIDESDLKERRAQGQTSVDCSAPGSSSQGSIATNVLLQRQMLANNMASRSIFNLNSSATERALNQLYQECQFGLLLQQRLLERQVQRECHLLALMSLMGSSAVDTQAPNSTLPNFPGTVSASSYGVLLSENVQVPLPEYVLGDLVGTSNTYAALPRPFSSVGTGNMSTRGYEQLLLSSLLQQRARQQHNHPSSNNS